MWICQTATYEPTQRVSEFDIRNTDKADSGHEAYEFFKSKRQVWITAGTTVSQMFLIVLLSLSTKTLATVFPNSAFTLSH